MLNFQVDLGAQLTTNSRKTNKSHGRAPRLCAGQNMYCAWAVIDAHSTAEPCFVENSTPRLVSRAKSDHISGDLIKPLLELTPADVEVLGFENDGPNILYRKWPGNYCEFNSELKLTHLHITGTSGICVGKSRTGPFICFPTSRKEFESVFGKVEKTVNLYDVVTWR